MLGSLGRFGFGGFCPIFSGGDVVTLFSKQKLMLESHFGDCCLAFCSQL